MIGVIDYGAGNLHSLARGIVHVGGEALVSSDPDELSAQDAIVLPGVGHAGQLLDRLRHLGMDRAILDAVDRGVPFLGICIGMQIMFGDQEEGGATGLGLLPGRVRHLSPGVKAPHMGWNLARLTRESPLGDEGDERYYYFVHSFVADDASPIDVAATTTYGETFPSVVIRDHLWGTQFHPEKSADNGMDLLGAFVRMVAARTPVPAGATARGPAQP